MNGSDNECYKAGWWRRIDIRWPWLKIALIFVGVIFVIGIERGWWALHAGISEQRTPGVFAGSVVRVPDAPLPAKAENYQGKKLIALTFDDGPNSVTTPKLLDILQENKVYVTFFVLGISAKNNPELVKRELRDGHEVESHTMYHQKLGKMSKDAVKEDIDLARQVLIDITGKEPMLTRPPYGLINQAVRDQANTPLALWTVDTLDWESRDANAVRNEIMSSVFDGAVVLMHDIYDSTVEGVRIVIDELRKEGYEFVTFSDLATIRGEKMAKGVTYGSFRP